LLSLGKFNQINVASSEVIIITCRSDSLT